MQPVSRISHRISTVTGLLATVLACFAAPGHAAPYASGWYGDVRIGVGHDSNTSRGAGGAWARPDTVTSVAIGGGYSKMVRENAELILSAYLRHDNYAHYEKLGNTSTRLAARYIFQLQPGYAHPWFDTRIDVTRVAYRGDQPRDGNVLDFRTSVNRRMSEYLTARTGFAWHRYYGDGDAFDTARREWFVGGDYQLSSSLVATLEYGYQSGTFSTSLPGHYTSDAYTGMSPEPVFGDCTSGTCTGWYAYASKGSIQKLDAGLVLTRGRVDYDFGVRLFDASSDNGRRYRDTWVGLGAIFTFQ